MIWDELEHGLARLADEGLRRRRRTLESPCGPLVRVAGRELVSFCSNDYLGLAKAPALLDAVVEGARHWGVGSGSSHLVGGHLAPHEALEQKLAAFTGFTRSLLFSTGYMANLGLVPALAGRGDAVFADKLNHASLIDAVQLAKAQGAESRRYPHGDAAALGRLLAASPAQRKLILTDAVFSMDGDLAPLPALLELAERHDAWLIVDDAHGLGVLGERGRGSLAHFGLPASPHLIYMGTLGKAAGVAGAFVAASATVVEWLLQRARTYVFTTGASPLLACALLAALTLIENGGARRQRLGEHAARLRAGLADTRWRLADSPTAIQPILIGDNHETERVADALFERGLWVPAIRPPTVPPGSARLRVSLSSAHDAEMIDRLVAALRELG